MEQANEPLRRLREHLGITLAAFGQSTGIVPTHVSSYERGGKPIGFGVARRILDAYRREMAECNVELEDLQRGTFSRPKQRGAR